jgi:hypothetical protein
MEYLFTLLDHFPPELLWAVMAWCSVAGPRFLMGEDIE